MKTSGVHTGRARAWPWTGKGAGMVVGMVATLAAGLMAVPGRAAEVADTADVVDTADAPDVDNGDSVHAQRPANEAPTRSGAPRRASEEPAVTPLPEVTVRGFGFDQPVARTSGSVAVLQADTIESMNLTELAQLNARVPGFLLVSSMSGGPKYAYIRGVGDFHEVWGRSVAVNIDGIPQNIIELQNPSIAGDIERIEVLKGPQQILNGHNGKAGAINLHTREPARSGGRLGVGAGNDAYANLRFAYHHVASETLSLAASFALDRDDGWIDNVYDGAALGDKSKRDVSVKAVMTPTDRSRVAIAAYGFNQREGGPLLVSLDPRTMKPYASYNAYTGEAGRALKFGQVSHDTDDFTDSRVRGLSVDILHDFGGVTLQSTTGWTRYRDDGLLDVDGGDDAAMPLAMALSQDNTLLHQNFRFSGGDAGPDGGAAAGGGYRWIAGVDGYDNDYDAVRAYVGSPVDYGTRQRQRGAGAYGQITWSPTARFDLTLGGRYQVDTARGVGKGLHEGTALKVTDRTVLFSGTGTWHLGPKAHLYASLSQSYYPTGIYAIDTLDQYGKEKGLTGEVGIKGRWLDDRLFASLSLYQTTIKNRVYTMEVPYSMWNVDEQRIRGVEIELHQQVTQRLAVGLSYSHYDPVITHWAAHPELEGNKSMQLPVKQANFNVSHRQHTPFGVLLSRLDVNYMGSHYGNNDNTFKGEGYTLVDLSLSMRQHAHTFTLWSRNLFDEAYYELVAYTSPTQATGAYGRGRSFGVNYRLDF